jgi:hypothetical protein
MKTIRLLTLTTIAFLGTAFVSAQTADEIIGKYMNAIGGKELVGQISSLYMEGTMDAMGNQGTVKTTQVNGKGFKQEIDVMGTSVVMCYTDSMGWQINPMSGNYGAETMSDDQYKAGKDMIFIGGPMMDYTAKGYKVELQGQEPVGSVNAYKLMMVSPDSMEAVYYIDPETFYLIRMVQKAEMMGQVMDIVFGYSNYQKTDNGYVLPYTIETNYGGQFFLVSNYTKVEINTPVDPAVFAKP